MNSSFVLIYHLNYPQVSFKILTFFVIVRKGRYKDFSLKFPYTTDEAMKDFMGIDQYRQTYHALGSHPRKELLRRIGRKSARKMYVDKKDGSTSHCGYVIVGLWIILYKVKPFEKLLGKSGLEEKEKHQENTE
jgi:hypothetical protein